MRVQRGYWTRARMLHQIREFYAVTGRAPGVRDLAGSPVKLPYKNSLIREFGTFNQAIREAGLEPTRPFGGRKAGVPPKEKPVILGRHVCPSCGEFVGLLRADTGWCSGCTRELAEVAA